MSLLLSSLQEKNMAKTTIAIFNVYIANIVYKMLTICHLNDKNTHN